ncbi:hypothetical protein P5V15_009140 [Pogonomyrmex californicus]
MKNRLYCIFVVLEILQSSICYTKIINETCRTKREVSISETSQSEEGTNYAKGIQEINLGHADEEKSENADLEENDTYQDNTEEERKISSRSNAEKSIDRDNVAKYSNLQPSNERSDYIEEADEDVARQRDRNEEKSNLVRLSRNVNSDKYTDQDDRSSLYDDYEAKDVAKRGVLNGAEDYEEMKDDPSGMMEDMAAVQERESINESEKRETSKDARVKRDQAILKALDESKTNPDNSAMLEESKIAAKEPYSPEVSRIEPAESFSKTPNDASEIKDIGSNKMISKNDSFKTQEPTSLIASPSQRDGSNAEYEKRVEEEIQRKIDSLKEEIQRDIEARQRIKDIEENNIKFNELQDEEYEDEGRQNSESEPIEKRQIIVKKSIQGIADDAATSKINEKNRSLKREPYKKRSNKINKLDTSKENLKRRFAANRDKFSDQIPSNESFKKKREHIRQVFLMNNDQHRTKKRQSSSYISSSNGKAVKSGNELFTNPDLNSFLHTDNKMSQASLPISGENENNEREHPAEHSDSLVSLTGSSQELNSRLEKEYREAFGGLQNEPGNALARFKRIKRVLVS